MFKSILLAAATVFGASAASVSHATPLITFSDLTDDPVAVTVGPGISGATMSTGSETASVSGTLHIPFGQGVLGINPASPLVFLLTEPGQPGVLSDWVQVSTPRGFGGNGPVDWEQFIQVEFRSDIDGIPLAPPAGNVVCRAEETGQMQICSLRSQTGDNVLDIGIQSDVSDIPEPATIALVGVALAAAGIRRRKVAEA